MYFSLQGDSLVSPEGDSLINEIAEQAPQPIVWALTRGRKGHGTHAVTRERQKEIGGQQQAGRRFRVGETYCFPKR
jgi:hypothetical protein